MAMIQSRNLKPSQQKQTTVANYKDVRKHYHQKNRQWNSNLYLYVGRDNWVNSLAASKWRNPFVIGKDGDRDEVLAKYRAYIIPKIEAGELDLEELRGKILVCWCSPQPCHADVLVELLNEQQPTE